MICSNEEEEQGLGVAEEEERPWFLVVTCGPPSYIFKIHNVILFMSININTKENIRMSFNCKCVKDARAKDVYVVVGSTNQLRDEKVLKTVYVQL